MNTNSDPTSQPIRLTETVQKGGCAAKLPAGMLREILGGFRLQKPAGLAVGTEHMDDACAWDLNNGTYMVQTVDFFTPIVDDAFDFGQIAAANAISDVYAMGAAPALCLSVLAFPSVTLPPQILKDVMAGAIETIHSAGACLGGGHTIDDDTLKFGLCVSGFVKKEKLWTNKGAKAGDKLILTKALGTGTITSALKRREVHEAHVKAAIASMKLLNRAPEHLDNFTVHSATDITGFGLAGHALQMARASGVRFEITAGRLPTLPGALEYLAKKILNKAHRSNRDYVNAETEFANLSEELQWLCVDPQTSGGLLLSVPAEQADGVCTALRAHFPSTTVIGSALGCESSAGPESPATPTVRFV